MPGLPSAAIAYGNLNRRRFWLSLVLATLGIRPLAKKPAPGSDSQDRMDQTPMIAPLG
jgi:hypothetical protein